MTTETQSIGRAVVTFGRSYQALAAVQSLGRRGVEVIVCDEAPMMASQFSKYAIGKFIHPPAKTDPEGFLAAMEENVRHFRPEDDRDYVLMPIHEQTRLLAEHKDRFGSLCRLATPPIEAIEQVDPKYHLTETAERLGLPVPKTQQIDNESDLDAVAEGFEFPVFLKLPHTSGGLGLSRNESPQELRRSYQTTIKQFDCGDPDHHPIAQESASGSDYCVTLLLDNGEVKATSAYRNIKSYPWAGGSAAIRETVNAELCIEIASRLMTEVGWHGVAEVDFIWNGSSTATPYLIEVNPRFWGGLFHSIESGIDYPWMLYELVTTGHVQSAAEARVGARTQVPMFGVLSAMKDIREDLLREMETDCERGVQHIKDGKIGIGLRRIARGLDRGIGVGERFRRLQEFLEENHEARTEIFSTEDPLACLGVFFGLAGLLRSGELPEQFGRR